MIDNFSNRKYCFKMLSDNHNYTQTQKYTIEKSPIPIK